MAVDDNFYTPLDEVNEFDFFLAAMEEFSNVQGDAYAALTSLLTDDYVQIFERSKVGVCSLPRWLVGWLLGGLSLRDYACVLWITWEGGGWFR